MFLDRSMKLEVGEAQALLKEYTGPQYEIERHMTVITLLFIWILSTRLKSNVLNIFVLCWLGVFQKLFTRSTNKCTVSGY